MEGILRTAPRFGEKSLSKLIGIVYEKSGLILYPQALARWSQGVKPRKGTADLIVKILDLNEEEASFLRNGGDRG